MVGSAFGSESNLAAHAYSILCAEGVGDDPKLADALDSQGVLVGAGAAAAHQVVHDRAVNHEKIGTDRGAVAAEHGSLEAAAGIGGAVLCDADLQHRQIVKVAAVQRQVGHSFL